MTRPHLDDGELLSLLDGEADGAPRTDGEAHLAACPVCRERMERYRTRRERLAQLLVRADFPVPAAPSVGSVADAPDDPKVIPLRPRAATRQPRFHQRPWLRAAAVVLLLVAAAVVATPARAWITEWVSRQWNRVAQDDRPTPPRAAPPVQAPPARPQASAQVRFVPSGSELRVDVASVQATGTLTLVPVDGPAASAEVLGAQAVELLVVPSGLRIRNTSIVSADYRVRVPDGVRRVRVRIGGAPEVTVERGEIGSGGTRLPLASRGS
ncbi:MAG TPA: hypothetical protein VFS20_24530 [Longimicrobium sp.]|nr:hypothetical protein [Longimicrobium sp.]